MESQSSGGWVLQSETVTNAADLAKQVTVSAAENNDLPAVLLVGASVRWAAQSAAVGGYRIVAMDLFGDLDTRDACVRFQQITPAQHACPRKLAASISKLADEERARVVWTGGLSADADMAGNPSAILHEELDDLTRRAGLRSPHTITTNTLSHSSSIRWLIKEPHSTGGLGVRFLDQWPTGRAVPTQATIQHWIPGRPMGLVAFANDHGVVLLGMTQSTYQRCGDLPFVYTGSRTITGTDVVPWASMQTLCEQLAETHGLRGLFNLDWIQDRQNQWWLLEINERPSASCEVLERAMRQNSLCNSNDSLMRRHLAAVLQQDIAISSDSPNNANPKTSSLTTHVKRIVYSRGEGRVHLSKFAQTLQGAAKLHAADASIRLQLADIPAEGTPVQRGQPIATLLVDSERNSSHLAKTIRHCIQQVEASVA